MKKYAMTMVAAALAMTLAGAVSAQEGWEQYLDQVRIKKAAADSMTPEQLATRRENLARMLAAEAAMPRTPADTCTAATYEISGLPFGPVNDTTVGATDDIKLPADVTAPTCTAAATCTGGASTNSGPRGAIYTGTGTGPDRAFRIRTSAACDLTITMDPATADMGLTVFQTQCSNSLADCACIDDNGVDGVAEVVNLTAVAGTDYFLVADGYSTGAAPPGPSDAFTMTVTGSGCTLVPVELQSFEVN